MPHRALLFPALVAALAIPASTGAQGVPRVRREIRGFDFRNNGVWRREARAVRARRHGLLAARNFAALNAPIRGGGGAPVAAGAPPAMSAAVSGVLRIPAILFKFKDTPVAELRDTTQYNQVLFAPSPTGASAGRPYTYTSFYAQMSNNLLSVQGQAYGYVALDSNEVTYAGAPPCSANPFPGNTNCNGLFNFTTTRPGPSPVARMQNGLREALTRLDSMTTIDWSQYDANGDGYVDLVAFIQPAIDGACGGTGNNHLWAHRFALLTPYTTKTPRTPTATDTSHFIQVSDYILESGVGGDIDCDSTQIMPIGTVAHETGHGFGLPDLYDTNEQSEGVGEYSLMGSGNYTSPFSPSRMDVWSLSQLGWVTVVPVSASSPYSFGPAAIPPTPDTAFLIRPTGSNPRGESFLLENRQGVLSDSAMIHYHCQVWFQSANPPSTCGGGLLVWHVDSTQIARHGIDADNTVNSGPIHGLELLQADGLGNLDANPRGCLGPTSGCSDRGDAGDLYPGTTGNTAVASTTRPSNLLNTGLCAGFRVDSISQVVPNGTMRFVLTLGSADLIIIATPAQLAAAQWGFSYGLALGAACGNGTFAWVVDSGAPPPGVTLAASGVLNGAPTDTGSYGFRAAVTSGALTARRTFALRVSEPVLTLQQVLNLAFLGPAGTTDDQRRYLDLQGNASGTFDLGDVLRWLERTGNVPAATAMARAAQGAGGTSAARVRP